MIPQFDCDSDPVFLRGCVDAALKVYPDLTIYGFSRQECTPEQLYDVAALTPCAKMFRILRPMQTINTRSAAEVGALKHYAEKLFGWYWGYVGEGHVVVMAHALGYEIQRKGREDVYFNIKQVSIRHLKDINLGCDSKRRP
jgi:hypothetical protein